MDLGTVLAPEKAACGIGIPGSLPPVIIAAWGRPEHGRMKRMNLCRAQVGVPGHEGEIQCRLEVIELALHAPQLA